MPELLRKSTCDRRWAGGGRLVIFPGNPDTVRSVSRVSLVIVDEAAQARDELVNAVTPMAATTNGRVVLMSSAYFDSGVFYDIWANREGRGAGWERIQYKSEDCSRISKEFLAAERVRMGEAVYRREYLCEFMHSGDMAFSSDYIDKAFENQLQPLFAFGVAPS